MDLGFREESRFNDISTHNNNGMCTCIPARVSGKPGLSARPSPSVRMLKKGEGSGNETNIVHGRENQPRSECSSPLCILAFPAFLTCEYFVYNHSAGSP